MKLFKRGFILTVALITNYTIAQTYIGATTTSGVLDWNDISNSKSGNGYTLLRGNATNGPALGTGNYFHPFNFEYGYNNGSGNITQLAIPYGYQAAIDQGIRMRGRYGITWSPWVKIISENTAGNVGIGTTNPSHKFEVNTGSVNFKTYAYGTEYTVNTTGGWSRSLRFRNENNNATATVGSQNGSVFISTGLNISSDPTGYQNQKLTVATNGNVGIGTTNPTHKFEVNTGSVNFKTYAYGTEYTVNTTGGWSRSLRFRNENNNATATIGSQDGSVFISTGFNINSDPVGYQNQKLTVATNGDVGIGTTSPDAKLAVNGRIHTKEVKVDLIGWPDYVFYDNYKLPTLQEVETHIKEKGHLKDIPSAKEVEENGIFLGDMNAKLLQKIEELTLYTIEQEKTLETQQAQLEKQSIEIGELKALVKEVLEKKN